MAAPGGGGGAPPPVLGGVLRHMLDVDEEDFDCTIELVFPGEPAAEAATQDSEGPPAKRARLAAGIEAAAPGGAAAEVAAADAAAIEHAAQAAADVADAKPTAADTAANESAAAEEAAAEEAAQNAASTIITCRASSVLLKLHSEVFRRWIKGWAGGQKQPLRFECEDRQEAEAFERLLAFVHSAGRTLPDEPLATLHLLAVARKHGVESCVDACLQLLLTQVEQMPLPACLRPVLLLETGTSGHEEVQAQADRLVQRTGERLQALVKKEAAAVLADAELLEALVAFFGRWHDMLNCAVRRKVWQAVPFELLTLMFEDRRVQADTEATVLGAFALWADTNIGVEPFDPGQRERVAAVCSRIRFPEVPADVLLNYWAFFKWLQRYDPSKDLLLRALVTASDVRQHTMWQSSLAVKSNEAEAAATRAFTAECHLWWTPRAPALVSDTDEATFHLQIGRSPTANYSPSQAVYWRGYWWRGEIYKNGDGVGIAVRAACSESVTACLASVPKHLTYRMQATYSVALQTDGAVFGAVAAGWCVQEWVIHAWLLHAPFDWVGTRIHVGHHQRPYFHVSIDDPPIVLGFMAASLTAFWVGFGGSELAVTASVAYFAMGLLYEYTHFIVHTRYLPHSKLAKAIRMHHMLHHTRNEAYWLAFIVPQVDAMFGTAPQPGSVRMSDMAKQGLKASRDAAAAASGASAGSS